MKPDQIRDARKALGLTQAQLGHLLDTDAQSVRRLELDPSASTARTPAPRMVRLIEAYRGGYRPPDWPVMGPDWQPQLGAKFIKY